MQPNLQSIFRSMKQLSFLIIILLSISLTGEDKVSFSVDKIKVSKFESLKNYNSRYGVRTYKDAHKIFLKVDYLITRNLMKMKKLCGMNIQK